MHCKPINSNRPRKRPLRERKKMNDYLTDAEQYLADELETAFDLEPPSRAYARSPEKIIKNILNNALQCG